MLLGSHPLPSTRADELQNPVISAEPLRGLLQSSSGRGQELRLLGRGLGSQRFRLNGRASHSRETVR